MSLPKGLSRHLVRFANLSGRVVDRLAPPVALLTLLLRRPGGSLAHDADGGWCDAELIRRGYIPLRFTYEQVLFQPEYVMETVLAVVRRRAHLRAPWA